MSNLQDPRVLFALERTLLAWNRSSLALIAFGFLIEKSNLLVRLIDPTQYEHKIIYSHWLAVIVISGGIIISLWSVRQFHCALKSLSEHEMIDGYSTQIPMYLGLFSTLAGVLLMISFWL